MKLRGPYWGLSAKCTKSPIMHEGVCQVVDVLTMSPQIPETTLFRGFIDQSRASLGKGQSALSSMHSRPFATDKSEDPAQHDEAAHRRSGPLLVRHFHSPTSLARC